MQGPVLTPLKDWYESGHALRIAAHRKTVLDAHARNERVLPNRKFAFFQRRIAYDAVAAAVRPSHANPH